MIAGAKLHCPQPLSCLCCSALQSPFSSAMSSPVTSVSGSAAAIQPAYLRGPGSGSQAPLPWLPAASAVRPCSGIAADAGANGAAAAQPMSLRLFRSVWGVEGDLFDFFRSSLASGSAYVGFEAGPVNCTEHQLRALARCQSELGLEFAAMVFSDIPAKPLRTVDEHLAEIQSQIRAVLALQQSHGLKATHINCHSGKDTWSMREHERFFASLLEWTAALPVPVFHETHRSRSLFHPTSTAALVRKFPELLLTADLSHWVVVCGRLGVMDEPCSSDDGEAEGAASSSGDSAASSAVPTWLSVIAPRVRHIHARVGYEHGPQVPDPRAPEYSAQVAAHERWWELIFAERAKAGAKSISLVPEWGPHAKGGYYLHTTPFTNQPVADIAELADWTASRMQHKFIEGGRAAAAKESV